MTKGRRIAIKVGPYEIELGTQKEAKDGGIYHVFTQSDEGLHASIHPSGRIHLRDQKDTATGMRDTDIRFSGEHEFSLSAAEFAEDILRNAIFYPSEYPNAFAVDIPDEYASSNIDGLQADFCVNVFAAIQQFVTTLVPLETTAEVLRELIENVNPNRIVGYMDPEAGFCILCPPGGPDEKPCAFSQKWLLERTRFGKGLIAPSNKAIDAGMEKVQNAMTQTIVQTFDAEILKEEIDKLMSNPKLAEAAMRLSEFHRNNDNKQEDA